MTSHFPAYAVHCFATDLLIAQQAHGAKSSSQNVAVWILLPLSTMVVQKPLHSISESYGATGTEHQGCVS